jgi:hypothetical protein
MKIENFERAQELVTLINQRERLLGRLEHVKVDGVYLAPTNSTALSVTLSDVDIPEPIKDDILSMIREWYESNIQDLKTEFENL